MTTIKEILIFNGREAVAPSVLIAELGIPVGTFNAWRKKGLLPKPIKLGKHSFFWRDEVMARLAQGE